MHRTGTINWWRWCSKSDWHSVDGPFSIQIHPFVRRIPFLMAVIVNEIDIFWIIVILESRIQISMGNSSKLTYINEQNTRMHPQQYCRRPEECPFVGPKCIVGKSGREATENEVSKWMTSMINMFPSILGFQQQGDECECCSALEIAGDATTKKGPFQRPCRIER